MSVWKNGYCRCYQSILRRAAGMLPWKEPQVISGPGSVEKIAPAVKALGLKRVLVVTGPSLRKLHMPDGLLKSLADAGIQASVFSDVQPNPTLQNIEDARKQFVDDDCQAIIAFGGGSVMDCAKVAGARVVNPDKSILQMRGQLKVGRRLPLLFAIPTTAGTGSETTIAAVVSNPANHEKFAVNDPHLRPDYAVLDPLLTVGLPPKITAATGMDALTHAVEAYIGKSNTPATEAAAKEAVRLIFQNLEKAYQDGNDIAAREGMLMGSYQAGMAFTRAYVGYVHAIAHAVGGLYGVAHGLANAIILPYVLEAYGMSAEVRLAQLAVVAGAAASADDTHTAAGKLIAAIRGMNERMGIPAHVKEIQAGDIPKIARRADKEANPLYPVPRIMDQPELAALVRRIAGIQ